jgi:AraC-like DNA-binding protein
MTAPGLQETVLLDDGTVSLVDVRCRFAERSPSAVEASRRLELVLPRAGTFARHTRAGDVLADPTRVLIFRPGEQYRISHPLGETDRSLAIGLRPEAAAELGSGGSARDLPSSMRVDLTGRRLADGLAAGSLDPLELGGDVLALAAAILVPSAAVQRRPLIVRPGHRRLVRRARLMLLERLGERLTLPELALAIGTSPFHLARVFRALTGSSIHEHRVTLRVRAALERLASGERDLTALALDLGFADHAHLTNTVRRELGRPPSAFRAAPTEAEIRALRTILQA